MKNLKRKITAILCISILILINTLTLAAPTLRTQKDLLEKENSFNVNIYTCNSEVISKVNQEISEEQAQKIIKAFFENEITEKKIYQQAVEKITILQETNLITAETAKIIENNFKARFQLYEKMTSSQSKSI